MINWITFICYAKYCTPLNDAGALIPIVMQMQWEYSALAILQLVVLGQFSTIAIDGINFGIIIAKYHHSKN